MDERLLNIAGSISSIVSVLLTLLVGVGVYRLVWDISKHRDNKHVKGRLRETVRTLGGRKPLTADASENLKDVLQLVRNEYVSWWKIRRKKRVREVENELPLSEENRLRAYSRLTLLQNSILSSKDLYDE
ncbi:hypothetical protein [Halofilum ochraceum]|uniref:hypothetical protein n=1 Tax=Halofilum ochraceum TaxID=1611323 RepID=UPI001113201F|nr:hypothetical protein [Halofilum ochraceum]